jgi:hypothetical protein
MAYPRGQPTIIDGVRYRSKGEASVAEDLTRRGVKFEYESERIFYAIPATYVTDFTIPEEESCTGQPIYVEYKGWFRPEDKRKLLAVKAENPGMDLRLLFQRSNPRNAQWCNRHGFKCALQHVPPSWLKENK